MADPKPKCVLIVDDDPDICETMQIILECHGYRVVTAESGPDALDKLTRGETPYLILLDLMMPGMSGMQLRDELLREPRFAAVPVVIVSAGGDVAAKAAAMGVEGLTKPIAIDVLLRTLERFAGDAPDDDE
jgi:CheY-like chemotaxis protein